MDKTRSFRESSVGDTAVEGLLNGILAGIVMAVVIVGIESIAGVFPLEVLGYFAVSTDASPLLGLFTHVAVSGIYGVLFGIATMFVAHRMGNRNNLGIWLGMGALYGLFILAVAEGVVLPRTASPLGEIPFWAFALAHLLYGLVLAWLTRRNN